MSKPARLGVRETEGHTHRAERVSLRAALGTLRQVLDSGTEAAEIETAEILGIMRSIELSILARHLRGLAPPVRDSATREPADTWLTADEVAGRLKHSRAWVYRQARRWSFAKRPSRKTLLISEPGLTRWLEHR